jgi:hypothetical protein
MPRLAEGSQASRAHLFLYLLAKSPLRRAGCQNKINSLLMSSTSCSQSGYSGVYLEIAFAKKQKPANQTKKPNPLTPHLGSQVNEKTGENLAPLPPLYICLLCSESLFSIVFLGFRRDRRLISL